MGVEIPNHLKRYSAEQNYSLYSYEDQSVWRYAMKQLYRYLKDNAHSSYVDGLGKTGISIEEIPKISTMHEKLQEFGWGAVPVSGFIPPAAFMSFQAHGILPIACEMRTMEHLLYTPAPDIVHEAAGHAPLIIDKNYSDYLKSYAEVASKAIISSEDLALYEAIRDLSDLKEDQTSTPSEIKDCEKRLSDTINSMSYTSEAQLLGRMNWWTAEYGLIGDTKNPKIFGAGLLSSIGESRNCLSEPKHIELSLGCLEYNYDITEQQPQLFVAKDFPHLKEVLLEMTEEMAFKVGGEEGLSKAKRAKTICTVVLENGSTFSGPLLDYGFSDERLDFLNFSGPVLKNDKDIITDDLSFSFDKEKVISVHGGPTSFEKYPDFADFVAKKLNKQPPRLTDKESLLKDLRDFRADSSNMSSANLEAKFFDVASNHWLAALEVLEITKSEKVRNKLEQIKFVSSEDTKSCIDLGMSALS